MERKLLRQRVIEFSISIQKVVKQLEQINQYVIAKQFLRSGTAIGVLVFEAEQAETRDDFIHKMKIALKEVNETKYWLTLVENLISLDHSIA
ncbi:MAG TPA: four helix bundle protein, partial [Chitinophagaceae bacterium]|nr:four helix bundle protein [Chitinophagaceae bacterium]